MPGRRATDRVPSRRPDRGASLAEMLIVLALIGSVAAGGLRALSDLRDERAGREAARGVVADLRRLASAAREQRRALALEFDLRADPQWRILADGNANGVTSADIAAGVDVPSGPWTRVFREGRATFGIPRDVPDLDGDGIVASGGQPIRLGAVTRITATPRGTATAGSLYITGRGGRVYAVRLLGTTQRIRLSCLSRRDEWETC